MHDPNIDSKKRMPPLIVLALTGPVGSGCTTVSNKIFDDPQNPKKGQGNELLNVLHFVGWVTPKQEGGFKVRWNELNNEVDRTYKKLDAINGAIKRFDDCKNQGDSTKLKDLSRRLKEELKKTLKEVINEAFDLIEQLQELEKELRTKLNKDLETRQAIKALDKLNVYYRKDTHFFRTISVSDLIVFCTLIAIEKEDFNLDDVDDAKKKRKYAQFLAIAKRHINSQEAKLTLRRIELEGYADYYRRCYDWKDKDELNKLGEVFYDIHNIATTIKMDFYKNNPYDYAEVMQDFGDNIRRCDDPFGRRSCPTWDSAYKLAKGIAQMIYLLYKTGQGAFFVVDCLRNPYEVIYLRREFANFYLLSIFADKNVRKERIIGGFARTLGKKKEDLTSEERDRIIDCFERADKRDSGKKVKNESILYNQNVTKCVQISDMAINNVENLINPKDIEIVRDFCRKPLRILCLILSPGCTKPNDDEMFMNMAYAMAVKSNCISRQVGTVIIGPKGYVVGAGWNDVAERKISCGLRAIRDLKCKEFRPYVRVLLGRDRERKISPKEIRELINRLQHLVKGSNKSTPPKQFCFCFKDEIAKKIVSGKIKEACDRINEQAEEKDKIKLNVDQIEQLVARAEVHQLEYCLVLHAEENAIIQSSKIGGMGLKGGIIYTTAEPCTLCAKKIQQVGINRVVYTVAYPESLSEVYMKGVELEQFEGVKPRGYIRLFMPHHDQKEWQYLESRNLVPMI